MELNERVSAIALSSINFARKLLEQEKMAVVPGLPFGADGNFRLSYACSMANIEEGMIRLERFVKTL
ncbi:MAG: aminotransferase class I/II-fold pyridoxal phosphate-dependent enzyme [bacterium]|jgi:aspartate aminotransferase